MIDAAGEGSVDSYLADAAAATLREIFERVCEIEVLVLAASCVRTRETCKVRLFKMREDDILYVANNTMPWLG